MQLIRKRGLYEAGRIVYLPVSEISPNPDQPRRHLNPEEMRELSESIAKYGVLQPLSVRRLGRGYELLSGERRMRAAMLAGLKEVPCVIMDVNTRESAVLMLVENLLRRDLDFIEEARGLSRLVSMYGYSQEEVARFVGLSQSAVANKIRLLKMPTELLLIIREAGLTERHARALLRLKTEEDIITALESIIKLDLTVAKTEAYIDDLLDKSAPPPESESPRSQARSPCKICSANPVPPEAEAREISPVIVVKDARLLINSITRGVTMLKKSGIDIDMEREEDDREIVIKLTISKKPAALRL